MILLRDNENKSNLSAFAKEEASQMICYGGFLKLSRTDYLFNTESIESWILLFEATR